MTTRLYDILKSIYRQQMIGDNPNIRPSYFLASINDKFLEECYTYTNTAKAVIQRELFSFVSFNLSDKEIETFQKDFITRFMNRGIKFQTFDLFKMHLASELSVRQEVIEALYSTKLSGKYLNEQTQTFNQGTNTSTGDTTTKSTSLPQTMVDFNSVDYADSLDNSQSNDTSKTDNTSTTIKMSIANLQSYNDMKIQLFTELDKALFSQLF